MLAELPASGSRFFTGIWISPRDIAALTAFAGVEFAFFTLGGRRLLIRGNVDCVPLTLDDAAGLGRSGWRWSGHTQPGEDRNALRSSTQDRLFLDIFKKLTGQKHSSIWNSVGDHGIFTSTGDSVSPGWLP